MLIVLLVYLTTGYVGKGKRGELRGSYSEAGASGIKPCPLHASLLCWMNYCTSLIHQKYNYLPTLRFQINTLFV